MQTLNIFFEEEEKDRWFFMDRYPRRLIRRIIRGKPKPTGHRMVASELLKGLDRSKIPYRYNDYRHIQKHPEELVCCITSYLLAERKWPNPILLGASIFSHPLDSPDLLDRYPTIQKIVVPGEWMRKMFEPYFGDRVLSWPVGIDTDHWSPAPKEHGFTFLIYDKIRWEHDAMEQSLINPITSFLEKLGRKQYHPRQYILDNLTLEKSAAHYLRIATEISSALKQPAGQR